MKKFYFIIAAIIVIILGLGAILIVNWVKPIPDDAVANAQFSAIIEDEGGVDTGSAFRISFDTEISAASVLRALTISPEIEIGVHQGTSKNEVLIAPASPLDPGTIYTFELRSENQRLQWAVQTKQDLAISEVRPADTTLQVSTSSAIEIVLNQMTSIDLAQVDDYITISPSVAGHFEQEGKILRFVPDHGLAPNTVYNVKISAGLPLANSDITLAEGYEFAFETVNDRETLWQISGQATYLPSEIPQFVLATTQEQALAELPGAESSVAMSLYQFASAADYAQILQEMLETKPSWSNCFTYLQGTSLSNTSLLNEYQVELDINANSATLTLPQSLSNGYYLLRCSYAGQSMDVLFAVSNISAYVQSYGNRTVFWIHDAESGQAVDVSITDESGFVVSSSSNNGIAIVERTGDAVYSLHVDDQLLLVMPYYQQQQINNEVNTNWCYLYLDQARYQAGDTLNYWGMVEPRDGSDLEYERVSVYIYAESYDTYVYRDYAQLSNGIFSGTILLPTLLDGHYRLEISQSGNTLISQEFIIGEVEDDLAEIPGEATASYLTLDKQSYQLGETFHATIQIDGEEYLFIEENDSGISATAAEEASYESVFAPANRLNSYLLGVAYRDGHYYASSPQLLQRDCSANMLDIDISGSLSGERSGEAGSLSISVKDNNGKPVAANIAVTIIKCEQKPTIDTWASVFEYNALSDNYAGVAESESLFFTTCQADNEGQATCQYSLPEFTGDCWLIVQALNVGENIQADSIVLEFGQGSEDEEPADPLTDNAVQEMPQLPDVAYQIGKLTNDTVLNANSILTIFGSQDRLEVLSLLFNQVFNYANNSMQYTDSAIDALAASHARQLLLDYGGDFLSGMLIPDIDMGVYQKADGGIGDLDGSSSLPISVKAVAAAPNNIDYYALVAYYNNFLENHSLQTEKAMALTGMALYGNPVLNDIRIMLSSENLSTEEYLWLIWGLYVSGDRQDAIAALDNLLYQTDDLDAQDAVLASVVCSLCGKENALELLNIAVDAGIDTSLEQVLVARVLLPQILQPESSFSYNIGGELHNAQMQGFNDFILNINNAEEITFDNINGNIYYLDIYALE